MAPLCKLEMTLPRVSGSREKRHDGAVDEQTGIQPARRVAAGSVRTAACRRRLCADGSDGSASPTGVPSAAWPQAGWRSKPAVEAGAGVAGAAMGCIQMTTGAAVSGLVATFHDGHSALSM